MTVLRQSQEFSITPAKLGSAPPQGSVGYTGPDIAGNTIVTSGDGAISGLLGVIAEEGQKLAGKAFSNAAESEYLRGASLVGKVHSEAEIESNPLTRDWAVSGFRDTAARMQIAQQEANLSTDMRYLRQETPDKMQEYLAERRAELVPVLDGMSLQQRKSAFAQLLVNDNAAITKHTDEHAKYIIEQEAASLSATMAPLMQNMVSATKTGSPTQQLAAIAAIVAPVHSMILENERIDPSTKQKFIFQVAENALATDQLALYDTLRNTKVPYSGAGPDGTTLLGLLPMADQYKLAGLQREAKGRNTALINAQYTRAQAGYEASFKDPTTTELAPLEEVEQFMDHGLRNGMVSDGEHKSFMKSYYEAVSKVGNIAAKAGAVDRGDWQTLLQLGATDKEGVEAVIKMDLKAGKTRPQIQQHLADLGAKGLPDAYMSLGDMVKKDFANLLLSDGKTVNAQSAAATAAVIQEVARHVEMGKDTAMTYFLQAFSKEDKALVQYIQQGQRQGKSPEGSVDWAIRQMTMDKALPEAERVALGESNAKEAVKRMADLGERQVFGSLSTKARSLFGIGTGSAEDKLRPWRAWFEDPQRIAESVQTGRERYLMEMADVSRMNPTMDADRKHELALSNVTKSTVFTKNAALFLPQGTNVQQYFGVSSSIGNDTIGVALSNMVPMKDPGNRATWLATNGRIQYSEYNKDGVLAQNMVLDPKSIKSHLDTVLAGAAATAKEVSGSGTTRKMGSAEVTFSGRNTTGVDDAAMFAFRDRLVKHEGITNTAYPDLSGKVVQGKRVMTVGVGLTQDYMPKAQPDGTFAKADTDAMFMKASDDAARAGARVQALVGKTSSPAAFQLFSELAYQSGTSFDSIPKVKVMLQAIAVGNTQEAIKALHDTPAYQMSKKNQSGVSTRQLSYEKLLRNVMEGK